MKSIIITGGNSGLGYQTAKQLANEGGWHIVIASRNKERVDAAIEALRQETGYASFEGLALDLGSLDDVRRFAQAWTTVERPALHAIVCNAGLSPMSNSQTADGIDMIWGVNHLGHYLLVHLLSPYLAEPGRVIFVSSGTHIPEHKLARRLRVPVPKYVTARALAYPEGAADDVRIDSPSQRYSTSKLCNVLATYQFAREFQAIDREIDVFAIDPGLMPGTGLARDAPDWLKPLFFGIIRLWGRWEPGIRPPEVSGQHVARLVTDPALRGKSGLYFDGDEETRSSAASYEREKQIDLWNTSGELAGLRVGRDGIAGGGIINDSIEG